MNLWKCDTIFCFLLFVCLSYIHKTIIHVHSHQTNKRRFLISCGFAVTITVDIIISVIFCIKPGGLIPQTVVYCWVHWKSKFIIFGLICKLPYSTRPEISFKSNRFKQIQLFGQVLKRITTLLKFVVWLINVFFFSFYFNLIINKSIGYINPGKGNISIDFFLINVEMQSLESITSITSI